MTLVSALFQPVAPVDFTDPDQDSYAELIDVNQSPSAVTAQYARARNRRNDRNRIKNKWKYWRRGQGHDAPNPSGGNGSVIAECI